MQTKLCIGISYGLLGVERTLVCLIFRPNDLALVLFLATQTSISIPTWTILCSVSSISTGKSSKELCYAIYYGEAAYRIFPVSMLFSHGGGVNLTI